MNSERRQLRGKRTGFTLVELLTVIAVIGILVGILLPVTQAVRASARNTSCQNNLRQLMMSVLDHEIINNRFPLADDGNGGSMFVELLPHLDQKFLYQKSIAELEPDETYAERMVRLSEFELPILFCASSTDEVRRTNVTGRGDYSTDYYGITGPIGTATSSDGEETYTYLSLDPVPSGGNVGLGGMFGPDEAGTFTVTRGSKDALDGAANTLMFGEISRFMLTSDGVPVKKAGWALGAEFDSEGVAGGNLANVYPAKSIEFAINAAEGNINNISFASSHTGGANFAFVDASVRFINQSISVDVLKTIASTNGVEQPEQLNEN